jgi:hypothetical protein
MSAFGYMRTFDPIEVNVQRIYSLQYRLQRFEIGVDAGDERVTHHRTCRDNCFVTLANERDACTKKGNGSCQAKIAHTFGFKSVAIQASMDNCPEGR